MYIHVELLFVAFYTCSSSQISFTISLVWFYPCGIAIVLIVDCYWDKKSYLLYVCIYLDMHIHIYERMRITIKKANWRLPKRWDGLHSSGEKYLSLTLIALQGLHKRSMWNCVAGPFSECLRTCFPIITLCSAALKRCELVIGFAVFILCVKNYHESGTWSQEIYKLNFM